MLKVRYREEYLATGVPQYLLHLPAQGDAPVLLFVHGGPGFSESFMGYKLKEWWGELFSLVFWDQRGSGKSLAEANRLASKGSLGTYSITVEDLMRDMKVVVEHLKEVYATDKLVVLGHSWGSVIGSLYAQEYPSDLALYIGVGQVVEMRENEQLAWEVLRERIIQSGNTQDLAALPAFEDIEHLPLAGEPMEHLRAFHKLRRKYHLVVSFKPRDLLMFLRNPCFSFSDFSFMSKDVDSLRRHLVEYLRDFNLRALGCEYQMPVAYLLGAEDTQASTALAAEFFERIQAPRKLLRIIEGAGHNTAADAPAAFAVTLGEARVLIG